MCARCGFVGPSFIQMDRASFETAKITGNSQTCMNAACRAPILVSKETVEWRA